MQEELTRWQELDEAVKMKRKVKGENASECLYLIAVRNIYAGFSAKMLTRAEAVEQKEQLVKECERYLLSVVLDDDGMKESLLSCAVSELKAFQRKYHTLSELAGVFKAIDTLDELAGRKVK